MKNDVLTPNWKAPSNVKAFSTLRSLGNLATHVGDDLTRVEENRRLLTAYLNLPAEPQWLDQVHGSEVSTERSSLVQADAFYTDNRGKVAVVLTADCLPVVLTNRGGSALSVAHAGWRGLLNGVLENAVSCFPDEDPARFAWLGPAIGQRAFEVGNEVYEGFVAKGQQFEKAFVSGRPGHWYAGLSQLAQITLLGAGLQEITDSGYCTFDNPENFFSFRREGKTGRMATLAWIE